MNENEVVEVKEFKEEGGTNNKKTYKGFSGVDKVISKFVKFIGKIIKKGNKIFLEAHKEGEEPITISLTIMALLLIFLSVPTVILLIIGLFSGYEYSLSGSLRNCEKVNQVFERASETAENIKDDFKKGYNE